MKVFFRSMATVIGPTPPGTGVIKPAFFFTSAIKKWVGDGEKDFV